MKVTFVAFLLALSFNKSIGQAVFADPAMTGVYITNVAGTSSFNANTLPLLTTVKLNLQLYNLSQSNAVPFGSIVLKIKLGTKMILDPAYSLATAPLSAYFNWTSGVNGGQAEITGTPKVPLPEDFAGVAAFNVIPNSLGTSVINANITVTNTTLLTDEEPNNNTSILQYTVVSGSGGPLPVNITKLSVVKKGCSINVNFFTESETNVDRYELEASKDGIGFIKVGSVAAGNKPSYLKDFSLTPDVSAPTIFVRVKAIDKDGSFKYSETKTVAGACDALLLYNIYPNPVADKNVMVRATSGMFNGKYKVVVMDMSGKLIRMNEVELKNSTQYSFDLGGAAKGKYILKIANLDGSGSSVLPFEKL
jgi:hypothetical protein